MSFSLINIGLTGLDAARVGLDITGHNITNSNVEGYRRQQVQQVNVPSPVQVNNGFLGAGTNTDSIRSIYSNFLDMQVMQTQSNKADATQFYSYANQLNTLMGTSSTTLAPAEQNFFNSIQNMTVAGADKSVTRTTALAAANTLVDRFHTINTQVEQLRQTVNSDIQRYAKSINDYSAQIAALNQKIVSANSNGTPNDLIDQRDKLVSQLNDITRVQVLKQDNGTVDIMLSNNLSLVSGLSSATITAQRKADNAEEFQLVYNNSKAIDDSDLKNGGTLSGLLRLRDDLLNPVQNDLGRLAAGVMKSVNDQQSLGVDLYGNTGASVQNFFTNIQGKNIPNGNNTGNASLGVNIKNTQSLTGDDYRVTYDGTNWGVMNTRTNQAVSLASDSTATQLNFDGLSIDVSGTAAAGDNFLVQPTRNLARDISVNITDTSAIANASPVLGSKTTTGTNSTAQMSDLQLSSPYEKLQLKFTSATTFDVMNLTTGATLATSQSYTAGNAINFNNIEFKIAGTAGTGDTFLIDNLNVSKTAIGAGSTTSMNSPIVKMDSNATTTATINFTSATTYQLNGAGTVYTYQPGQSISFNGWNLKVSGDAQSGDVFTVQKNTTNMLDNRNALAMAGLQNTRIFDNGVSTIYELHAQITGNVGTQTKQADNMQTAQTTLLQQTTDAQQSVSGVSLDEEAANLIRYQQMFMAASKTIQVANSVFDSILALR